MNLQGCLNTIFNLQEGCQQYLNMSSMAPSQEAGLKNLQSESLYSG